MWIFIIILAVIALIIWSVYNGLITAKVRVSEALSEIDVQLKRRTDLIPNLIETVKGYAAHEKQIFEDVAQARSMLMSAKGVEQKDQANNQLTQSLKSLFAISENYPALRATENFSKLQDELTDTEDKIAYSRQFYNGNVMDYNTRLKVFPNVFLAKMFTMQPAEFFGASKQDSQPVTVKF